MRKIRCSKDWDAFENSLQAAQRFYNQDMAKAGFQSIYFGIADCVWDNKCPSGDVNAFNFKKLQMKAHKDYFFPAPKWASPVNQVEVDTAKQVFSGAFGTGERRAHGHLTNVS